MIKKPFSAVSAPAANRTEGQKSAPAEPSDGQLPGPTHNRPAGESTEPREGETQSEANPTLPASQSTLAPAAGEAPASLAAAGNAVPIASMQQVLITAREQCWLSARADGAAGREYTLRPGESFVLTFANSLDISLGNAGGVSIIYNGKNLGRAGKSGQRAELHFPMPAQNR
jgi:cytoskeleton protein RodZ